MAALRIILPAAAIALTLALFLQLAWPARAPIPRRTSRRGGIGIAVLTAVYAVAAFTGLGSANAPQRFCTLEAGESATLALDGVHSIDTVWYYTGLYTGEYTLAYSDDGITYTAAGTMPQGYALQMAAAAAGGHRTRDGGLCAHHGERASGARRACALRPAG